MHQRGGKRDDSGGKKYNREMLLDLQNRGGKLGGLLRVNLGLLLENKAKGGERRDLPNLGKEDGDVR